MPVVIDQQLRARPERVRPDREHRVFAGVVLAQLRADARQQHGEAERLRHVIVGAGFQPQDGIGIGVVAGQHDDRRLEAVLAQHAHRFAAVDVRQFDVHDHEVDLAGLGELHALGAGIAGNDLELVMQRQLLDQRLAQFVIVIDNQNCPGIRHRANLLVPQYDNAAK